MKKAIITLLVGTVTFFYASIVMAKVKPIEIPIVSQKTNPNFALNLEAICTSVLPKKFSLVDPPSINFPASSVAAVCKTVQNGVMVDLETQKLLKIIQKNDKNLLKQINKDPAVKANSAFKMDSSGNAQPSSGQKASAANSPAVGSYESMLIQGMADFIVKRAKAELVFMLQDSLKRDLCIDGQYADFFPNTCKVLASVTETSSIQSMGTMLQKSAEKDIEQLPDTALGEMALLYLYFDNDNAKKDELSNLKKITSVGTSLDNALNNIPSASGNLNNARENLISLQNGFKDEKNPLGNLIMDSALADIDSALKITNSKVWKKNDLEMAKNLIESAKRKIIRKNGEYKQFAESFTAARIGLAFYRESRTGRAPLDIIRGLSELEKVDCEENTSGSQCQFPQLVRALAIGVRGFEQAANMSSGEVSNYEAAAILLAIGEIQNNLPSTIHHDPIDVSAVSISKFAASMNGIKAKVEDIIATTDQLNQGASLGDNQKMQLRIKIARLGIDTMCYMVDSGLIKDTEQPKKWLKNTSLVLDVGSNYLNHDNAGIIVSTTNLITQIDDLAGNPLPTEVTQYLPLLVQVASAKSSEDVANVLEAAAAPVGSYRGKYESFSVSVTALFGVSGGGEYLLGDVKERRWVGSLFSPVGVTMTWPYTWDRRCQMLRRGYWGPMVSVIDFGPYLTAGEQGKDFKVPSNLQFKNIFSPGLYVIWNPFYNYPIVLGVGASYNTNLRLDAKGKEVSVARGQVFIAADLTLFPLGNHMKPRKKK